MSEVNSQCEIASTCYYFKWNDYHSHLSSLAQQLLEEDCMVDVTLSVAGERIHAHRIVLCACSTLFQEIISETREDHPTIIISDIAPQDVRSIVEFCYHGEVRVPVDNITNLLDAAHSLKICGLMEVEGLDENDSVKCTKDGSDDNHADIQEDSNESGDKAWPDIVDRAEDSEEHSAAAEQGDAPVKKKRKRRRDGGKKKNYSEEMLAAAINDVRAGQSLVDAATKNQVPRSTLYMRAKGLGVQVNAVRSDYPAECLKAAINAVINGASFSQASDMYRIPKTVLWRRIQKEGYQILRSEMKRSYDADKREAAVKALERGEKLTKVAQEYKIPKTTLFRDKVRLVDEGKLPESFWKKRSVENGTSKKLRLEEAVTACKEGKMSQAAASLAYHIPKTTIWRRLRQDNQRAGIRMDNTTKRQTPTVQSNAADKIKCEENAEFELCQVPSEIPITYINENSIPADSVIILTTEDVEELDLEEGRQIMVNSVCSGL